MEIVNVIALTLGVAWASGINLYAAILVLGIMGAGGYTDLPSSLTVLQNPLVLMAAAIMYFIEFFADKIPGVDSAWDAIHTFIRIPAGAMLAVGAAQGLEMNQAAELATALLGGSLAATSHLTKASTRLVINTSPEPITNSMTSIGEDIAVVGGLWAALNYPAFFIGFIVVFILLVIWLLPRLWNALKAIVATVRGWKHGKTKPADEPDDDIIQKLLDSKSDRMP